MTNVNSIKQRQVIAQISQQNHLLLRTREMQMAVTSVVN